MHPSLESIVLDSRAETMLSGCSLEGSLLQKTAEGSVCWETCKLVLGAVERRLNRD